MCGIDELFVQKFGWKTQMKNIAWKTWEYVGGRHWSGI